MSLCGLVAAVENLRSWQASGNDMKLIWFTFVRVNLFDVSVSEPYKHKLGSLRAVKEMMQTQVKGQLYCLVEVPHVFFSGADRWEWGLGTGVGGSEPGTASGIWIGSTLLHTREQQL